MVNIKEIEKYTNTISKERLYSFNYNEGDTLDIIIERYKNNIRISQALYPELSMLEITLRNAINSTLCRYLSKTWIEDEIKQQNILSNHDYEILCSTYNEIKRNYKNNFTIGKVIANLNFGFWTNLCSKKYCSKIWNKGCCFKGVFTHHPSDTHQINEISIKLRSIRKLRNRIFHYEPIFKNPEALLNKYNEIMEIISYLPNDDSDILKSTTSFLKIYNKIFNTHNKTKNLEHCTIKS